MKAMQDWSDDPRLTALALGELEGDEMEALERELEADPAGRAALGELAALAAALADELAAEVDGAPALSGAARAAIVARARRRRRRPVLVGAAAAAGLAAAAVVGALLLAPRLQERSAALGYPIQQAVGPATTGPNPPPSGGVVHGRRLADGTPQDVQGLQGLGYFGGALESSEAYAPIVENPFHLAVQDPLSTFSIDVDTASYANVRRFLDQRTLPPPDAVRIEEMINYFPYDYPLPEPGAPFSVTTEVASAPWASGHRLVRIGLRGSEVALYEPKEKNLVFLIDVSGSMSSPAKLPLLKRALALLVEELSGRDRVAVVVYAGSSGVALPSTPADRKAEILAAIDRLEPGGSTHGSQGIELAYWIAERNRAEGGVNRVVLCTDGDFNVGVTGDDALVELIEEKRRGGTSLSVLGFGTGNLQDSKMEALADHGNGNYAYVDSLAEARKVLVREMGGTLETIAKDVKIQVEFDPARVESFRLIGYENRVLAHEDFEDDAKDAGEIGAGHRVTALYEVVPAEAGAALGGAGVPARLGAVRLRFKDPDGDESRLLEAELLDDGRSFAQASPDLRFAAAVAGFGMVLRRSPHAGDLALEDVHRIALGALDPDPFGYRVELVRLVERALALGRSTGR